MLKSTHTHRKLALVGLLALLLVASSGAQPAAAQAVPQVRAILFFSPTCPHCHYVITEVLPPLTETYGDQLAVQMIDTTTEAGHQAYQAMLDAWAIPQERWAVPFLLVGDRSMVGSLEIEQEFPKLIASYLATGGIDWPAFPGVEDFVPAEGEVGALPDPSTPITWVDRFQRDPLGNGASLLVLLGLVGSLVWNLRRLNAGKHDTPPWRGLDETLLVLAGLFVAGYLTWVESTLNPAICGPVGDCNAVQQSEYARLFGLIPVGWLGLAGFLLIGIAWLADRRQDGPARLSLNQVTWYAALFGLLFSVYLTFLEPFVIGATCVWCLSSAILMGLIFWQATSKWLWLRSQHTRKRRASKRKGYSQ